MKVSALVTPALRQAIISCSSQANGGRLDRPRRDMVWVALGSDEGLRFLDTGLKTGFGDERLRLGPFKVMTDGSSSGPTCATRQPYSSDPTGADCGILYWTQAQLDQMIARAHRAGFQCTMHAMGDRAIEAGLTALERAFAELPRPDPRPRIEHCGLCPPDLQERVVQLGVTPAMQPAFFWEFGDGYLANYGRERADTMFPVRSLTAAGVVVAWRNSMSDGRIDRPGAESAARDTVLSSSRMLPGQWYAHSVSSASFENPLLSSGSPCAAQ